MKKQVWINSGVYLISMIAACLLNLAVTGMALKIVLAFADIGYFATAILRIVIGFLTGAGVIGAIIYHECYKSVEFHPGWIILSMSFAGIVHLGLSTVLMFYPFIAGGVRPLAGILCLGTGFDSDAMIDYIYLWAYLLAFLLYLIFQICVSLLCGFIGKKMRLKNREGLKGYHPEGSGAK